MDNLTPIKPEMELLRPARIASNHPWLSIFAPYVIAVLSNAAALLVSLQLGVVNSGVPVLMIFLVAVILSAYAGGLRPGLTATVLAALLSNFFILQPVYSFQISSVTDVLRWSLLNAIGIFVCLISEALHRSRRRAKASERLQRATLDGITDGVITTDPAGRITFLNKEAERLTGWGHLEAVGQPLSAVFRIVSVGKREPMEDPVQVILRLEAAVELSNHTILIARNGKETSVENHGAPIRQADGIILGVVLVFRDCSEKQKTEQALQLQQKFLCETGRLAQVGGWDFDLVTGQSHWGEEVARIFDLDPGQDPDEGVALGFFQGQSRQRLEAARLAAVERGTPYDLELEIISAKQNRKWIRTICQPVMENGRVIKISGAIQNITAQKMAETALLESKALYHSLVEQMPAGFFCKDAAGRFVLANALFYQITNNQPEQLLGKSPPEAERAGAKLEKDANSHHALLMQNGQTIEVDEVHRSADGKIHHIHAVKSAVYDLDGKKIGTQGVLFDVTQSKLATEALRESEERYRTLVNASPDAVTMTSVVGRIEFVSSRSLELFGYPSESELVGRHFLDWIIPEEHERAREHIASIMAKKVLRSSDFIMVKKDGARFNGEIRAVPFHSADGWPKGIIFITRDITEHKRAEEAHMRLATAVEQVAESILITDAAGIIQYVNPAFEATSGYSWQEAIGRNPSFLKSGKQDADFYKRIKQTLAHGEVWSGHFINRKKDGTLFQEESTISPIRDSTGRVVSYVAVKRDVTREVEMEAQLRQSQKMDAIGQLAGGIAHDFNNLLTAIRGNASMVLLSNQSKSLDISDCTQQIVEAAERAANLTRQLLMFSRKQVVQPIRLNLNEAVSNMTKLLQRILGEDITLVSHYETSLPAILADTGMIEQILLNLAVNSRDAMPKGGQLTITTGAETLEPMLTGSNPRALSGWCVRLTVTDTGCGIAPTDMAHIFEPFFTTKEVGKGTGLGLATVHGIVEQHQGWITVTSEINQGTTFHIYFPVMDGEKTEKTIAPMAPNLPRGTETILVVEDETIVRLAVSNMLQRFGYTVLQAESGKAALKVWAKEKSRIQLLLTDIVMPDGMTGYELGRHLEAEAPRLKVIYTSGYSGNLADKRLILTEGFNFLQKPYTAQKLAEALRKNLDPK